MYAYTRDFAWHYSIISIRGSGIQSLEFGESVHIYSAGSNDMSLLVIYKTYR